MPNSPATDMLGRGAQPPRRPKCRGCGQRPGRRSPTRGCKGAVCQRELAARNAYRMRYYKRITHEPRQCPECGDDFTPTRSDAIYCTGKGCRKRAERKRKRAAR